MRRRDLLLSPLALAASSLSLAGPATARTAADDLRFFRILTGSAAATAFPIGTLVASAISNPAGSRPCDRGGSCGVPGLIAVALTSAGSVANLAAIANESIESGFAQADLVYSAYNGEGFYFRRTRFPNLRVIANLYPETVHLVARRGSGIQDIRDLVGKTVSIDRAGSGTRFNAEIILNAYGVRLSQIKVAELDPGEASDRLTRGEIDAFFVIAAYPAQIVADLTEKQGATVVPLAARAIEAALKRHRFFSREVIPANSYAGVPETETLSIGMQWVVAESADAGLVYDIVSALWQPASRKILDGGHVKAQQIRRDSALSGLSTPLHFGAERYYREAGLLS
ncbi:TAXI family TRAP transporter solute-binding subunit [Ferrovibrio sp. MS7]|jgi:TRAP transporter TAXI family solute receptor|uniref:TAXI family TRAP transporter solute-binding subunit n=1 Tax=Ferrovibrio plantarum TaxID=3119164 RepID=UPI0031371F3B